MANEMDDTDVMNAVADLRNSMPHHPEEFVRKWTALECDDERVATAIFTLIWAYPAKVSTFRMKTDGDKAAMRQIVNESPLSELLQFDGATGALTLNPAASPATLTKAADLLFDPDEIIWD